MIPENTSRLAYYIKLAVSGTAAEIRLILAELNAEMTFADSRFIDYALSLVTSHEGVETIRAYLFEGTQVQRNYCTLFFSRRCAKGDWETVKQAYRMGLIDQKQAFSK